jgi:hypothetical protein
MGSRVRGNDRFESNQHRQPMPSPRHRAFGIAGHAGPAYFGAHRIDRARRRHPDSARQRRTAFAIAAHSREPVVDEFFRDQLQRGVILGGEPWPVRRIGTAGAAALAGACLIRRDRPRFHRVSFSATTPFTIPGFLPSPVPPQAPRSVRRAKQVHPPHQRHRISAEYAAGSWYPMPRS